MKKLLSIIFGVHSPLYFLVALWMCGRHIGTDHLGNKYYQGERRKGYSKRRRWVNYVGRPEASNVPPEWHGWLHYQTDDVPESDGQSYRRKWQKPHKPNMTGTNQAYRPPGHILSGGKRDKATGDYEPWTPPE